ncbi:MAG: zinc-ribbon domain-containing protein [Blastocatellia bacterium]
MAIVSCTSCGAQIDDTSRFCRVCGRSFDPAELTTRKLEPGVEFHAPTQPVNQSPTTPAYVPPVQFPVVPATNDLAPRSQNRTIIVLLAAAVGLLLFLVFAVYMVKFNSDNPPTAPPAISIPPVPTPPGVPAPPFPPPAAGDAVVGEELIYPGADEVMTINAKGKGVLQLRTKDSASKVVEWYIARLKPTEHIKLPGGDAILRAGDIAVVIGSGDEGTSIMITRGGDDEAAPPR